MKKPTPKMIQEAVPLTKRRAIDPLQHCTLCGSPSPEGMDVMRECDERDRPLPGLDALIFIGRGAAHEGCLRAVDGHPRLYETVQAHPGHMALICTSCVHRKGLVCRHPGARANGGLGLTLRLERPGIFAGIICIRGPKGRNLAPPREGVACSGREERA